MTTKIPVELSSTPGISDSSNATAITIDSSEQVGIGTTSPSAKLQVQADGESIRLDGSADTTRTIFFRSTSASNPAQIHSDGALKLRAEDSGTHMEFHTADSERMRISSAGTILVGKTAEDTATDGIELNRNDVLVATRDGDSPLLLNRRTSDGTIAEFRRDNNVSGTLNSVVATRISLRAGSTAGYLGVGSTDYFAWNTTDFRPAADDSYDLGASGARFDDIYATNGTIQTSDQNEKNTITNSDLGLDFINRLSPKSYKFNSKTRTHYGLIAQDVETVLSDISKSTTDFAGFIKDDISEEQDGSSYRYGLRYNEFISPLIKAIQEQQTQIEALQAEINTLKGE